MFRRIVVLWLVACFAPGRVALATEPTDKAAAIVGDWESLDRHIAMGSLYQLEHGVRKREGVVRFSLEGDRLTGLAIHADHAAISHQERWDGTTKFNNVSYDGKKLSFEWEIGEWYRPACAIDVEDCRLPNKGTIRVVAELRGIRLIGKWGMFLSDGSEAFRGEWEAVRANGANVNAEGAATIMLIGGSHQDLSDNLRSAFFLRAGGSKAKIVVIPTAIKTADEPETDSLLEEWRKLKPLSVELLHTRDRTKANDPAFVKPLTEATAVFFTNGHRDRIFDAYRDTLVQQELKNLWARGGLIGGTGTGAAVLGSLVGHRGEMELLTEPGLDLASGFMIEDRDEPERFAAAIAAHPDHIGVYVDPATAVILRGRRLRVLGEATAAIRLAPAANVAARVEILTAGAQLDIAELQSAAVERAKPPAKPGANAEQEAVQALRGSEPNFTFDDSLPNRPVVAVHFPPNYGKVRDADLVHLKQFRQLRSVRLPNKRFITDVGLAHLENLEQLEELNLNNTRVSAAAVVQFLRGRDRLQLLDLTGVPLSDNDLAELTHLTNLRTLNLRGTLVTDRGAEYLKGFPQLRWLNLSSRSGQITDVALAHLKALTNLEDLDLDRTAITDAGLRHLRSLHQLHRLQLAETAVTDAGLEHLHTLANLTELNVRGTKVTPAGMAKLKERLPQLNKN